MIIKKKILGKTKIKCPIIGFGGAPIGNLFKNLSNQKARIILEHAQKNNINFYDTSPLYGYGLSEKRIGEFLKSLNRNKFLLSTKVGRYLVKEDKDKIDRGIFKGGLNFKPIIDYSYDGVMRSFEQSLKRLNVDYIDLCLLHDVDYFTHKKKFNFYFKQSLNGAYVALQKLKEENLVRAIGLGLNDADVANKFILREDFDCVLLAGRYTLLDRTAEKKFFKTADKNNVGIILAGIFNSGILAKGLKKSTYFYKSIPNEIKKKYLKIKKLCDEFNIPVQAAAIQFPLRNKNVSSIILGMDEVNQIQENLNFLSLKINNDFWEQLDNLK